MRTVCLLLLGKCFSKTCVRHRHSGPNGKFNYTVNSSRKWKQHEIAPKTQTQNRVGCRIVCRTVLSTPAQLTLRCPIAHRYRCESDYLLRSNENIQKKWGATVAPPRALNSFPLNRSLMLLFWFSLIFLTCSGSTSRLKLVYPLEVARVLPLQ